MTRTGDSQCFCLSDFKKNDFTVLLVIVVGFCGNAFSG